MGPAFGSAFLLLWSAGSRVRGRWMMGVCRWSCLELHALFPTVVATDHLDLDPLELAALLQTVLQCRAEASGNPDPGCAWTGDLNGVWQLHQHAACRLITGQVVGRHHHPNAHLSAVLYLSGDGSGADGSLCLHAPRRPSLLRGCCFPAPFQQG